MRFKIISVGWECPDVLEQTLRSVERQHHTDWRIHVVDDCSGETQQDKIRDWCEARDERWMYTLHSEHRGAVRNQYEGVRAMDPDDEDIIVFLDLDGDQLAHEKVLDRLEFYYQRDVLMTYGSYRPVPDLNPLSPVPVSPYPDSVVAAGSYREDTVVAGTRYNHLRTAKWKLLKHIPESHFRFPDGEWLVSPTDLIVMMGCLELAAGRYQCIEETLLLYNAEQPNPDNVHHPAKNVRGSYYVFGLTPLKKLTL